MITPTTSARNVTAQFPLFTNLPAELQALVWKFARQDRPVLRHYLLLARLGQRAYATVDLSTRELSSPDPKSCQYDQDIPADPSLSKVHFPEGTRWEKPRSPRRSDVHIPQHSAAWVDFDRDIFFIANTEYQQPGQLRFLIGNTKLEPQTISAQHWARRIQRLALDVYAYDGPPSDYGEMPTSMYDREVKLDELDLRVLPELDSLKILFLIVKMRFTYWSGERRQFWREPLVQDRWGFTTVDDALMATHICDSERVRNYCPVEPVTQRAGALKAQLESILNLGNKRVEVRIVIDRLRETYLYHDK